MMDLPSGLNSWKQRLLSCSGFMLMIGNSNADLSDGLEAYWPMNGKMADVVSNHHLAPRGEPGFVAGRFGQALSVNGIDQYLETVVGDDNALLPSVEGLTISAWLKPMRGSDPQGAFIAKGNSDSSLNAIRLTTVENLGDRSWFAAYQNDRVEYAAEVPLFRARGSLATPPSTPFTHVAITVDRERTVQIFANGEFLTEQLRETRPLVFSEPLLGGNVELIDFNLGPSTVRVGRNHYFNDSYFAGIIDDLAIWRRPLSEDEIGSLSETSLEALFPDEDKDRLYDFWERRHGLNPLVDDSQSDKDGDTLTALQELTLGTNPNARDSDKDGLSDQTEDGTGKWNGISNSGTRPELADTDEDGLLDGDENPDIPNSPNQSSQSNPNLSDSDGDGFSDDQEFAAASDALDAASKLPLIHGLIAHWPFEGNLLDTWGDHHGTMLGELEAEYVVDGPLGTSVVFRQSNDRGDDNVGIQVASDNGAFEFLGQSFSISAWIRAESPNDDRYVTLLAHGGEQPWTLFADPIPRPGGATRIATLTLNPSIATADRVSLSGVPRPGNPFPYTIVDTFGGDLFQEAYHHVLATYDTKTGRQQVYLDGVALGFIDTSFGRLGRSGGSRPGFGNGLRIGADPFLQPTGDFTDDESLLDSSALDGAIDELAIWRRVLTTTEIQSLYNNGKGASIQTWIDQEDADSDRISDLWEEAFSLDPTLDDAQNDNDFDGFSNLSEYRNGTIPVNSDDRFQVVSIETTDEGSAILKWKSSLGQRYTIKSSNDLVGPWRFQGWGILGQGDETTYSLDLEEEPEKRFYRVYAAP